MCTGSFPGFGRDHCGVPSRECYLDSFVITRQISSVLKTTTESPSIYMELQHMSHSVWEHMGVYTSVTWVADICMIVWSLCNKRFLYIIFVDWSPSSVHFDVSLFFSFRIFADVPVVLVIGLNFVFFCGRWVLFWTLFMLQFLWVIIMDLNF